MQGMENPRREMQEGKTQGNKPPLKQRLPAKLHYANDKENIILYFYLFI